MPTTRSNQTHFGNDGNRNTRTSQSTSSKQSQGSQTGTSSKSGASSSTSNRTSSKVGRQTQLTPERRTTQTRLPVTARTENTTPESTSVVETFDDVGFAVTFAIKISLAGQPQHLSLVA
jgi:hypothetical protein